MWYMSYGNFVITILETRETFSEGTRLFSGN